MLYLCVILEYSTLLGEETTRPSRNLTEDTHIVDQSVGPQMARAVAGGMPLYVQMSVEERRKIFVRIIIAAGACTSRRASI
jgi:hypothetical protein